jgi:ATP-dependent DNA helicase 2 subunit 2
MAESNNHANQAYVASNPEDEEPPYSAVACDVAIQTAKPKTVEVVMNLEVGEYEGNRAYISTITLLLVDHARVHD